MLLGFLVVQACVEGRTGNPADSLVFDSSQDLLSLHYDHAADPDDGYQRLRKVVLYRETRI